MGKCTCSLSVGVGNLAPTVSPQEVDWPAQCSECKKEVASSKEAGYMGNSSWGIKVVCLICMEIGQCFFCECTFGSQWQTLRKEYGKIGLGNLTELLSPEAKAILIEKADQWFLEDNQKEEDNYELAKQS